MQLRVKNTGQVLEWDDVEWLPEPGDKKCSFCGAGTAIWKHNLSKALVVTLQTCARAALKNHSDYFHYQKDVQLTHNQRANLQKLQYFGLLQRVEPRSGIWRITDHAKDFLMGRVSAAEHVRTFREKVLDSPDARVYIHSVLDGSYEWQREFADYVTQTGQKQLWKV